MASIGHIFRKDKERHQISLFPSEKQFIFNGYGCRVAFRLEWKFHFHMYLWKNNGPPPPPPPLHRQPKWNTLTSDDDDQDVDGGVLSNVGCHLAIVAVAIRTTKSEWNHIPVIHFPSAAVVFSFCVLFFFPGQLLCSCVWNYVRWWQKECLIFFCRWLHRFEFRTREAFKKVLCGLNDSFVSTERSSCQNVFERINICLTQ